MLFWGCFCVSDGTYIKIWWFLPGLRCFSVVFGSVKPRKSDVSILHVQRPLGCQWKHERVECFLGTVAMATDGCFGVGSVFFCLFFVFSRGSCVF